MSERSVDVEARYRVLRESVQTALTEGLLRAQEAVRAERVRAYWEIGGHLLRHLESIGIQHGDKTIVRLADDLNLSRQVLYDAMRFRSFVPTVPAQGQLTWSHYRRLLSVQDLALQTRLLGLAEVGRWSLRELDRQIQDAKPAAADRQSVADEAVELQARRGELFLYRTIKKRNRLALDLGFRDSHPIVSREALTSGLVVRSVRDGRFSDGYRVEVTGLRSRPYAFSATVEKFIDGDTLWATIDLGFGLWADRKLRLRGIDTPEVKTAGGGRALGYLKKVLDEAGLFVVTTTKIDLYDRYLADLFVLPGETDPVVIAREGRFVNRELVDQGLARLWTNKKPPEF